MGDLEGVGDPEGVGVSEGVRDPEGVRNPEGVGRSGPRTFCMVSHDMEKGLALSSHLLILERGRVVLFARKDEIDTEEFTELYHRSVGIGVA